MTFKREITEEKWRISEAAFREKLLELLDLDPKEVISVEIRADYMGAEITVVFGKMGFR